MKTYTAPILALLLVACADPEPTAPLGIGTSCTCTDGAEGPEGDRGPTGPAGQDSAVGAPGRSGIDGSPGPTGASGPTGPQGPAGATGPAGQSGAQGAQGVQGIPGASGSDGVVTRAMTYTRTNSVMIPPGSVADIVAVCDAIGDVPLGGGCEWGFDGAVHGIKTKPDVANLAAPAGWRCGAFNSAAAPRQMVSTILCAEAP